VTHGSDHPLLTGKPRPPLLGSGSGSGVPGSSARNGGGACGGGGGGGGVIGELVGGLASPGLNSLLDDATSRLARESTAAQQTTTTTTRSVRKGFGWKYSNA